MRRALALLSVAAFACSAPEPAAPPSSAIAPAQDAIPANLVMVELLAGTTQVTPGETFLLGARFAIADGWHIYWENPGDSGIKTRLRVSPPVGFGPDFCSRMQTEVVWRASANFWRGSRWG